MKIVLLNDTSPNHHHGCSCVTDVISSHVSLRGGVIIARSYVNQNWEKSAALLEAIKKCDLIIVNGEGTIHHGAHHAQNLLKVALMASRLDKPAFLINATWQNNPEHFFSLARQFTGIYVRESLSAAQLHDKGINAIVVPDLTFAEKAHSTVVQREGFAVTDSVYNPVSLDLYEQSLSNDCHFLPVVYKAPGLKSAIRFRFGGFGVRNIPRRLPDYCRYLGYKRRIESLTSRDRSDYLSRISALQAIITARFHSLCFAVKLGTPFAAIKSNSHKIEGMLLDIGISPGDFTLAADYKPTPQLFTRISERCDALVAEQLHTYSMKAACEIDDMFTNLFQSIRH